MYATSKLIIPPKIVGDSPYVPKIRIRLRPSPLLDKNCDMGSSLGADELACDTSQSVEDSNELDVSDQSDGRFTSTEADISSPGYEKVSEKIVI